MKALLLKACTIIMFFVVNIVSAQEQFTLNMGTIAQKEYFAVIPYQEARGLVFVEATINGKPYKFMLDTGAPMTITQELFDELKLNVINKLDVTDSSSKKESMAVASLDNITIGGVTFNNTAALVSKKNLLFECFGIDGLIGSNLLRNSIVQFLPQAHTVTITNNAKLLKLKKKYSTKLFLTPSQSSPYINVKFSNGKYSGKDFTLVDSGMAGFYDTAFTAFRDVFSALPLFTTVAKSSGSFTLGLHGVPDDQEQLRLAAPQLEVSNSIFTNIVTETTYDNTSRIGAKLFNYGVVTVDYKNEKFYFEPYEEGIINVGSKEWPISPTLRNGKMVVGVVWDNMLKDKINTGDEILQFGDITYADMPLCEILVKGSDAVKGETVQLVLKDINTGARKELTIIKK